MTSRVLVALAVLLPASVSAQVIPTHYRVTRSVGQAAVTVEFTRAGMQCGLPPGAALNLGVQIEDAADEFGRERSQKPARRRIRQANRLAWGHQSRHCVYCGKVGPRVVVVGGYAHRRCIPRQAVKAK